MTLLPPGSTLFPYTTLFRSVRIAVRIAVCIAVCVARRGSRAGDDRGAARGRRRSEEHTAELQSQFHVVCRRLRDDETRKGQPGGRDRIQEPTELHLHLHCKE